MRRRSLAVLVVLAGALSLFIAGCERPRRAVSTPAPVAAVTASPPATFTPAPAPEPTPTIVAVTITAGLPDSLAGGEGSAPPPTALAAEAVAPTAKPSPTARAPATKPAAPAPTARPRAPTVAAKTSPLPSPTATPSRAAPAASPSPGGIVKVGSARAPAVTAREAVLIDGTTGEVLYEKNAHRRVAPASLTKIVTAIVALERAKLDARVTVDVDSRKMYDSTVMGLIPGDTLTVRDLLYGLMLPSGNDAALAIARYVAGSDARFVTLMNQKAAALGLRDSHFANPHGLDASGHYSSAYDMVMLARYGMRNGDFAALAAAKEYAVSGKRSFNLTNLNKLLWGYAGADGVKIGYTEDAGRTIVGSATRRGHRLYVALMHTVDRVTDSAALLDYGFQNYAWR